MSSMDRFSWMVESEVIFGATLKKQLMETGPHSQHFMGLTLSGTHSLCYGSYSISYGAKSLHWFIYNCASLCNDVPVY